MKAAVVLSVATTALGAIVVRDAATVKSVIDTSSKDIQALTEAVGSYNGDKGPLVQASDKLISDLKAGKKKVTGSGELGLTDAAVLGTPVTDLATAGSKLTDALKAKKSEVEKAGECKLVQSQIDAIYTNSNDLINTVIDLVVAAAKPVAEGLAGQLTKVLDDAKSSYKDCQDSGSSGDDSGSSSGASQPTSAAQTSAAAQTSEAAQTSAGNGGTVVVTTDCATSTGAAQPTNSNMPPVVNGAAAYAPAGIFAAVVAAFAL